MVEVPSILVIAGVLYGAFALLGLPLAMLAERVRLVRHFCFNAAALLRETGNVAILLAFIFPPALSAWVAAIRLRRRGVTDPGVRDERR